MAKQKKGIQAEQLFSRFCVSPFFTHTQYAFCGLPYDDGDYTKPSFQIVISIDGKMEIFFEQAVTVLTIQIKETLQANRLQMEGFLLFCRRPLDIAKMEKTYARFFMSTEVSHHANQLYNKNSTLSNSLIFQYLGSAFDYSKLKCYSSTYSKHQLLPIFYGILHGIHFLSQIKKP